MAGTTKTVDLIWSGDSRSAVKAVSAIADSNSKTTKQLKDDADEQTASLDKVRESTGMLQRRFLVPRWALLELRASRSA